MAAVGRSYIKRHPQGTSEYRTTLDILTVSIGAQRNYSRIAKEKAFNLAAEGYMRREAKGIVDTQMLNDDSRKVMTKELAEVIKQHPNRAEDISDFLGSKLMTPVYADLDLLRIYLGTEIKVMAEGVL